MSGFDSKQGANQAVAGWRRGADGAVCRDIAASAGAGISIRDLGCSRGRCLSNRREDASLGIGQESVVSDWPALVRQVANIQERYGNVLVERYIAGREFNVGIIELPGLHALPIAEIEFCSSPEAKWPIVTYAGKWDVGSAADRATPVRCRCEESKLNWQHK